MEYNCHAYLKYLVFQMESLVFQMKNLVFWSKTWISIEKLSISNQNASLEYLVFRKKCKIPGFKWILRISFSINFRRYLYMRWLMTKYFTPAQQVVNKTETISTN